MSRRIGMVKLSCAAAVRVRMVTMSRRAMVVDVEGRSLLPPGPDRMGMMGVPAFTVTLTAYSHGVLHLGAGPPRTQGLPKPVLPPPPHRRQRRRRRRRLPPGPARRRGTTVVVATVIGGRRRRRAPVVDVVAARAEVPQLDVVGLLLAPLAAPAAVHSLGVAHLPPEVVEQAAAAPARHVHQLAGVLGQALDDA